MDCDIEVELCAFDLEHVKGDVAQTGGKEAVLIVDIIVLKTCRCCRAGGAVCVE